MAILDALPNFAVTICVDGETLEEYDDDEEVVPEQPGLIGEYQAARTVSKYIEAISDKEFTINILLNKGFEMDCPRLSNIVRLDGREVLNPLIGKPFAYMEIGTNRMIYPFIRVVDGSVVAAPGKLDEQLLKAFKFCKIESTMDDEKLKDVKNDLKVIRKIGEIEIKVYRASEGTSVDPNPATSMASSVPAQVHEKALKGDSKSHGISFGAATKLVKMSYIRAEKLDGNDYPIAIFRFKYRSRDALKSLLIIERTPTPEPEAEDGSASPPPVDINNLNETQKKQLARLLQDMNRVRSSSGTPQRTIKRERVENHGEFSKKRRKSGKSTVIDLTEDSDEENVVPAN